MMIEIAMMFEIAIPTIVSIRMRRISRFFVAAFSFNGLLAGSIRCSSASWDDCHTNR
jgi:hypothetical protein